MNAYQLKSKIPNYSLDQIAPKTRKRSPLTPLNNGGNRFQSHPF
ncbi:hypothetical protein PL10110_200143 [Planktothrix agardhii]|nr:hypothetical protein PL10110_200143 [Planktothrix agardhii]